MELELPFDIVASFLQLNGLCNTNTISGMDPSKSCIFCCSTKHKRANLPPIVVSTLLYPSYFTHPYCTMCTIWMAYVDNH